MDNLFETCARRDLCKTECPTCNNDMCLGIKDNTKSCACYDKEKIINDASLKQTNDEYGWLEIPKELFEECFVSTEKCEVITYSLGTWDAKDGKGCREHILTSKDFEDTGYYEYLSRK